MGYCKTFNFPLKNITQTLLVVLALASFGTTLTIMPCRVQNILIQPHFGISVKTQKLIEVIQAPPLLTQTIQMGICLQDNNTFTDHLPNHICRQRYTSVEVYSKLNPDKRDRLRGIRNILKLSEDDHRFQDTFIKDFVLVEAGCDIFFNYLSYPNPPVGGVGIEGGKPQPSPGLGLGLSDINLAGNEDQVEDSKQQAQPRPSRNYDILRVQAPSPSDFKQSNLKPRSMVMDDFLRKGLHMKGLNPKGQVGDTKMNQDATSSDIPRSPTNSEPEVREILGEEGVGLGESDQVAPAPGLGDPSNAGDPGDDNDNHPENVGVSVSTPANDKQNDTIQAPPLPLDGTTGEQELKPENIGLPLLFLDPDLDPIWKLISSVNVNLKAR